MNGSHFSTGEGAAWPRLVSAKGTLRVMGWRKKKGKWKITTCPEGIEQNWKCLRMWGGKTTQQLILSSSVPRMTLTGCWSRAPALEFVLEPRDFYCQQKGGKFEEERDVGFLSMRTERISGQKCGYANHTGPFTDVHKCQSWVPWHHQEERRAKWMRFQSSKPCFSNIYTGVPRGDWISLARTTSSFEGHLWNEVCKHNS